MCIGHKYGKVEDGYQYCIKCGYARNIPHEHHWIKTEQISVYGSNGKIPVAYVYVYNCSICGEIKKVRI
jgi:hypothetical protein